MKNLLQVSGLSKAYGPEVIFDEATLNVNSGQKIAVIGRNGAGKSTLFKIITGLEKEDSGNVLIFDHTRLGYLKQEDDFIPEDTVMSYLLRMSDEEEWKCAKIASQFELKGDFLDKKISALSGGYQMRVKLALMLLYEPNLILLDEPTNYLDLSTVLLLENFLMDYKGSYLIISHDRRFIKQTCNEILDIENGKAFHYPGPLEDYLRFKIEKRSLDEKFNKKQEDRKKHLQQFVDRFGAKASKAAQAKSKTKQIEKLKFIGIENTLSNVMMKVPAPFSEKGFCWRIEDLEIGYKDKSVSSGINLDITRGDHIAILGDNGQGKSTFMKTLAKQLPALSGIVKPATNLKVGYYAQHVATEMNPAETVESYLEKSSDHSHTIEEVYKMASNFLFKDEDIKKPISILSGGEKSRLAIAGLLLNRFDALLLDEPTNHLDFETAEILAFALAESKVTVLFITHDRTFVSILADRIIEVGDGKVKDFYGDFENYVETLQHNKKKETEAEKEFASLEKDKRREQFLANKALKQKVKRLDAQLKTLKDERDKIMKKFEDHPNDPNVSLVGKLQIIEEQIADLEDEWLDLNEQLQQ